MPPVDIFLSHASADRQFADQLVATLRQYDLPVWYSPVEIVGARQWHDEIGAALNRCDWFALILSPQAVDSIWVKRELQFALRNNRYENKIVPILYQPCEYARLSWTLDGFQMVDFTASFMDGCTQLLRAWDIKATPAPGENAEPGAGDRRTG
ncbi:MAG: toll/interleukin-1 receptor domain-containing protein [Blastocatellia bacterium]